MASIYTTAGLQYFNNLLVGEAVQDNLTLRIYTNALALTGSVSFGDFTELSHPDYTAEATVSGDWSIDGDGYLKYVGKTWEINSPIDGVVGFYFTADFGLGEDVLYASEFPDYVASGVPISIGVSGGQIVVDFRQKLEEG